MELQGKCQLWSLICAFCVVFFEETEGAQAKREHIGLFGSKGGVGRQVQRAFGQLENRRGRGKDESQREKEDPYSNIEMLLIHKGNLEQNNLFVVDDDKKDTLKNSTEPDFDLSLGSWFESLLYSDYESQDIFSHEHDDTHGNGHGHSEENYGNQEVGHKPHSHPVSEGGQEGRHGYGHGHGDEDHPDKKKQIPTSSHASVSMATWLISFSSVTVISVVRFIKAVLQ